MGRTVGAILFSFVLVHMAPDLFAQNRSKLSRKALMESKYHFLDAAKKHSNKDDVASYPKAAMNFYRAGKTKEALRYFIIADSLGLLKTQQEQFAYFDCLKSQQRYDKADDYMNRRAESEQQTALFRINANRAGHYEKILAYGATEITGLPVNSTNSEFGPTLYDGLLYFTSSRPVPGNKKVHRLNMQPYYNLYATPLYDSAGKILKPSGKFGVPESRQRFGKTVHRLLPAGINQKYHDGPVFVSKSGRFMFITTNWQGQLFFPNNERVRLNIFYSVKKDSVWSGLKSLPFNNKAWSTQHAAFREEDSTLYFSSNRQGGFGGYDIWRSRWNGAEWTEPSNLGAHVNTLKNEVFPCLAPDGALLFSSDGWPGLGGLDVFISDDASRDPVHALAKINSPADDFSVAFLDSTSGFLVSNRSGTKGDDDLWHFRANLNDIRAEHGAPVPIWIKMDFSAASHPVLANVEIQNTDSARLLDLPAGQNKIRVMVAEGAVITGRALGFKPLAIKLDRPHIIAGEVALLMEPDRALVSTVNDSSAVEVRTRFHKDFKGRNFEGLLGALNGLEALIKSSDSGVFLSDGQELRTIAQNFQIGSYSIRARADGPDAKQSISVRNPADGTSMLTFEVDPVGGSSQGWSISVAGIPFGQGDEAPIASEWYDVRIHTDPDSVWVSINGNGIMGFRNEKMLQPGYLTIASAGMSRFGSIAFAPDSTSIEMQGKPLQKKSPKGLMATLYFQYGRVKLRRGSRQEAEQVVQALQADKNLVLKLTVRSSCPGRLEMGHDLAERRISWLLRFFESRLQGSSRRLSVISTESGALPMRLACHFGDLRDDCDPELEEAVLHRGIQAIIYFEK